MASVALSLSGVAVSAPEGATWNDYLPRSLESVIEQHQSLATESDPLFTANNFPSRARVIYLGKKRRLPKDRADFVDKYFAHIRGNPDFRGLFKSEVLVREGGREYWLSIQKELLPALKEEVEAGTEVEIYVTWLGGIRAEGTIEWIFTINEFEAIP